MIKECQLETKEQLRREEDNIIKVCLNDQACLNGRREFTTSKEKKEYMHNYGAEYDKLKETKEHREQYRNEHKKEKSEYDKYYRQKNIL